jgi:hypothetical protein
MLNGHRLYKKHVKQAQNDLMIYFPFVCIVLHSGCKQAQYEREIERTSFNCDDTIVSCVIGNP